MYSMRVFVSVECVRVYDDDDNDDDAWFQSWLDQREEDLRGHVTYSNVF